MVPLKALGAHGHRWKCMCGAACCCCCCCGFATSTGTHTTTMLMNRERPKMTRITARSFQYNNKDKQETINHINGEYLL